MRPHTPAGRSLSRATAARSSLSLLVVAAVAGAVSVLAPMSAASATSGHAATAHPHAAPQHASHHSKADTISDAMAQKLTRLRSCESGGRYGADTGNGYYGAYQFADPTWHDLGFHGLPSNASAATQDAAAMMLHDQSGWSSWPTCAKQEHL